MSCNKNTMFESEDDIVISGITGRFLLCENISQLQEALFNKKDLGTVTDKREWIHDHPNVPQRIGKLLNIEKFDADYFDIPFTEAYQMDLMSRMILEHTYEAIVDAEVNPKDLNETRTGVFIGLCTSESEKTWIYQKRIDDGLGVVGCGRYPFANHISYWLNLTGPSYAADTACSSSFSLMTQAHKSIKSEI